MTDDRAERLRIAFSLNFEQQKKRAKELLRAAKTCDSRAGRDSRLHTARLSPLPG